MFLCICSLLAAAALLVENGDFFFQLHFVALGSEFWKRFNKFICLHMLEQPLHYRIHSSAFGTVGSFSEIVSFLTIGILTCSHLIGELSKPTFLECYRHFLDLSQFIFMS